MITNNGFLWILSAGGAEAAVLWLSVLSLLLGDATVDETDDDDTVRDFFLLFLRRRTALFEFDSAAMVIVVCCVESSRGSAHGRLLLKNY